MDSVSAEEMLEVEENAVESGVTEREMMENAGERIAEFVEENFSGAILVYAGPGNNGGDALNAAKRLQEKGFRVSVKLMSRDMDGVAGEQLEKLEGTGAELSPDSFQADVVIDGLVGYGLEGAPRGKLEELIQEVNNREAPVVSIDVPSGFEVSSGSFREPHVSPDHTIHLGLPKKGYSQVPGKQWVADIGIPRKAVEQNIEGCEKIFEGRSTVRRE